MAYNISIIAVAMIKAVLDLEVWIKFFNSNYILQTAGGLPTQYQIAKLKHWHLWDIGKVKSVCGNTYNYRILSNYWSEILIG